MNRRSFLKTGLGSAALGMAAVSSVNVLGGSLLNGQVFAEDTPKKRVPIALQLYSLRETAPKDVAGTLKKVAEMGYEGVEFAGYYGMKAEDLKKLLDDLNLKAVSTHIGLGALQCGEFEKTADFAHALGMENLVVPSGLAGSIMGNEAACQMAANLYNEISYKAEKAGLFIGYHCHTGEFQPVAGKDVSGWEYFLSRTREQVIAELDAGWCAAAGKSPAEMIKKFPGRSKVIHVKSCSDVQGTVVGDENDKVDWKSVFEACETVGGTQWYIVEQEQYKVSELNSVEECLKNLKKMGK